MLLRELPDREIRAQLASPSTRASRLIAANTSTRDTLPASRPLTSSLMTDKPTGGGAKSDRHNRPGVSQTGHVGPNQTVTPGPEQAVTPTVGLRRSRAG